MRASLPRLRARIGDLRSLDVATIRERSDPRINALEQTINSTLADIFAPDTFEYREFGGISLDKAPMSLFEATPIGEVREGLARGIAGAIASLEAIVSLFEEKLGGAEDSATRAKRGLNELSLHADISRAVKGLFSDGHYSNAVEDACKVLNGLVKLRSDRFDLSGTELMQKVFSPNGPVLAFSDLQTETDRSLQQGMMFLYAGAMLALRNPRAHEIIQDDAENALEYIGLINMLAKALDRTRKA